MTSLEAKLPETTSLAPVPEEHTLSVSLLTKAASNIEAFGPILSEMESKDFVELLQKLEADNRRGPLALCRLNYALGALEILLERLKTFRCSKPDWDYIYLGTAISRCIAVVKALISNYEAGYTRYTHSYYNDTIYACDGWVNKNPLSNMSPFGVRDDSGNAFRGYKGSFFDSSSQVREFILQSQKSKGSNGSSP